MQPFFKTIFDSVTKVKKHNHGSYIPYMDLCPILSNVDLTDYFIYNGSLTTPDCREGVTWIVFRHPLKIFPNDAFKLWSLRDYRGKQLSNNFRNVMPLNNRKVYHFKGNAHFIKRLQLN